MKNVPITIASGAGLLVAVALCAAACGAGSYGHAAHYVELDEETTAAAGAREYDPVMVERQPDQWRRSKITLFGIVESREVGPGGQAKLKMSVRRLEPRNLCERESDEETCRVTVSDKDFGIVTVFVSLRGDDDVGPRAVGPKSLLRIVGTIGQDVAATGAPIMHAIFYRHWPAFYYVTRASARDLRQ
ncbi:MAG: hypothetical protein M3O46_06700 [Myxococcota bacterium]|nr:hypothetical protein [Myxococcota bacterium]